MLLMVVLSACDALMVGAVAQRKAIARAPMPQLGLFDGAVGFSQGGALATCIPTRWLALFSTVPPPAGRASSALDARASFHCYDPAEEGAADCARVQRGFDAPSVALHDEGHRVSARADIVAAFCTFVDAAVASAAAGL